MNLLAAPIRLSKAAAWNRVAELCEQASKEQGTDLGGLLMLQGTDMPVWRADGLCSIVAWLHVLEFITFDEQKVMELEIQFLVREHGRQSGDYAYLPGRCTRLGWQLRGELARGLATEAERRGQ